MEIKQLTIDDFVQLVYQEALRQGKEGFRGPAKLFIATANYYTGHGNAESVRGEFKQAAYNYVQNKSHDLVIQKILKMKIAFFGTVGSLLSGIISMASADYEAALVAFAALGAISTYVLHVKKSLKRNFKPLEALGEKLVLQSKDEWQTTLQTHKPYIQELEKQWPR